MRVKVDQMDVKKKNSKRNVLVKAWERCKSLGNTSKKSSTGTSFTMKKSKSWHNSSQVAPVGCVSVYVGPERQRFAIKTELVNHPLFMVLLEDAELEYGFNSEGPLLLPCEVDLFYKVVAEIDASDDGGGDGDGIVVSSPFCGLGASPSRCRRSSSISKGSYGSYKLLSPSPMIRLNSN